MAILPKGGSSPTPGDKDLGSSTLGTVPQYLACPETTWQQLSLFPSCMGQERGWGAVLTHCSVFALSLGKQSQLFSLVPTLGQKGKVESSFELEQDLVIRPTRGISLTFCF